jgi:hypothetical protein
MVVLVMLGASGNPGPELVAGDVAPAADLDARQVVATDERRDGGGGQPEYFAGGGDVEQQGARLVGHARAARARPWSMRVIGSANLG